MARRKPAPTLSACEPHGSLDAPRFAGSICDGCGELVHPVHLGGPEWTDVDNAGRAVVDRHPAGYLDDPAKWWADLAEHNIGAYSELRCRQDLGMLGWVHFHRPGLAVPYALAGPTYSTVEPGHGEPPFCHGQPMWASPYGWVCRRAGYRSTPFPYASALKEGPR